MNLKQRVENNPIYFILTIIVFSFVAGWNVNDTLRLKIENKFSSKNIVTNGANEGIEKSNSKNKLRNCKSVSKDSLPVVIDEPYFTNGIPTSVKKGEKMQVSIPYAVEFGSAVAIWAHEGEDTLTTKKIHTGGYQPSDQVTGVGVLTRWFVTDKESRIRSVDISVLHLSGQCSTVMWSLPVDIQVK